jgi:hypothetical protein
MPAHRMQLAALFNPREHKTPDSPPGGPSDADRGSPRDSGV